MCTKFGQNLSVHGGTKTTPGFHIDHFPHRDVVLRLYFIQIGPPRAELLSVCVGCKFYMNVFTNVKKMCLFCVTEAEFSVKTDFVAVDFNDGSTVYDKIRPHLDNKDVGILGLLTCSVVTALINAL